MNRLCVVVGSAVVAGLVGGVPSAQAQADARTVAVRPAARVVAATLSGSIEGTVLDERGTPLPGVMVSALGSTSAIAVTDGLGTFVLRELPSGAYMVRAHLAGFAPSRRQLVEVHSSTTAWFRVTLQKTSPTAAVFKAAPIPPPAPPKILSASLAPNTDLDPLLYELLGRSEKADGTEDRTEKAWRIRHLPRSVLKDTTDRASAEPENGKSPETAPAAPGRSSGLARAIKSPARLLSDLPLTGQVNVMTSGSFDGSSGLGSGDSVHGTANFAVAGPAGNYGDWSARVLTQSDLGSWFLAGSFRNRSASRYQYAAGFSYSSQRVVTSAGIDRFGLKRADFAGRAAGSIYGSGRLVVSPRLIVDYGGRYSRYDYLSGGLFSPRVAVTLVPLKSVRIRAGASRRMLAPGAEEFLEPLTPGLWVPPERTFVGFSPMVSEGTAQFELSVEHDLAPGLVIAVRSFRQNTDNQQVAFFTEPAGLGRHYGIGNAGDVIARGWSVGISHQLMSRLRGSVAYEVTNAEWQPGAGDQLLVLGFRRRPEEERLHDVTTSLETDIPVTATHVYVAYRLNTGFAAADDTAAAPSLDSRFDLQVTQRLPFLDFTSARWQVLVAVKNMFRDGARDSSVYDELLVVRPPTRILGGFVVKF